MCRNLNGSFPSGVIFQDGFAITSSYSDIDDLQKTNSVKMYREKQIRVQGLTDPLVKYHNKCTH